MDLPTWIAFGGLLFTVVFALLSIAYKLGELNNRVRAHGARISKLEDGEDGEGAQRQSLTVAVARLEATIDAERRHSGEQMASLTRSVDEMKRTLANMVRDSVGGAGVMPRSRPHD